MENKELLLEFLNVPLDSGDEIFKRFASLPNAIVGKGDKPFERYVYIRGTKKNKVLLTSHIDTVWDKDYDKLSFPKQHNHKVIFENGIFKSGEESCGIGADDRAGCAMLWKMKDSGHSILILDGEEDGKRGAWYLRSSNPKLYKEINDHSYMIALDHVKTNHVSFAQVDNTKAFKKFFTKETSFVDKGAKGGCDLQVLCYDICGANVGIGYEKYHTKNETLVLADWENTYARLEELLSKEQRKYKIVFRKRIIKHLRSFVRKLLKKQ